MKRIISLLMILILTVSLCGCGKSERTTKSTTGYYVWYLSSDGEEIQKEPYEGELGNPDFLIDEFLNMFRIVPEEAGYQPLLDPSVSINSIQLEKGLLTLDFSESYQSMDSVREVLVRAGIVRTLVQIPEVKKVMFTAGGGPITISGGETLSEMDADSFIEDSGKQINAIQHNAINLYFADETGTELHKESRSIYYSANKPVEWAIVERIIAGPKVSGNYATVPAGTQILGVTSANNICYVNLSQSFINSVSSVAENIAIYSIVNSIVDNSREVNAVQFSIEGNSEILYRQTIDLSKPIEADMSLVKK